MRELEGMYRQKGIGEVLLEVREGNDAARALYGKLGYEVVSRLENYYGTAHGLYLKKMLK
jgi:ribosomal protein S18 acetylase RimI-like enzyme